jgi:hypothetical protein
MLKWSLPKAAAEAGIAYPHSGALPVEPAVLEWQRYRPSPVDFTLGARQKRVVYRKRAGFLAKAGPS